MAYIAIDVSTDNRVLTITDNGIGMNEHEIEYYLTKLGSSFYSSRVWPQFRSLERRWHRDFVDIHVGSKSRGRNLQARIPAP
jgi:hypothetical protein